MIKVIPSFLSAELARNDISNLSRTMFDLQRQSASGFRATDLKGFGEANRQIISTRAEIQRLEARTAAADRAETRLGIQGFALEQATEGMKALRESSLRALTQGDGRFVKTELDSAFRMVQSALNQSFAGQFLFSGERSDEAPIKAATLEDLRKTNGIDDVFTRSPRDAVMDIGDGDPMPVADQVSTFAGRSVAIMRDMANAMFRDGGGFSNPLSDDQRAQLSNWVTAIDSGVSDFLAAQGRNGALQKRVEGERERLSNRIDYLNSQVGEVADANMAEVAMKIAAVQTQYQAAGRVFAQLSELSILNYLR